MEYLLPKGRLSYSMVNTFYKTKTHRDFYKTYLLKDPFFETDYLLFGKWIGEILDHNAVIEYDKLPEDKRTFAYDDHTMMTLLKLPYLEKSEVKLKIDFKGVNVIGYIDRANTNMTVLHEYKTSVKTWEDRYIDHLQLETYCYGVHQLTGKIPKIKLIWLETIKDDCMRLTGKVETYEREITKQDLEKIENYYLTAAKDITEFIQSVKDGHELKGLDAPGWDELDIR